LSRRGSHRELTAEDYERLLALDEGHKKHKAATVTDLSMLPTHVASEAELASGSQEDNTCCVCLSTIDVGDVVKRLPCLHAFHAGAFILGAFTHVGDSSASYSVRSDCIDGWLKVNATCPIDKTTVFE
jgi:E3 ubiquitin-protein ligase SDIR1